MGFVEKLRMNNIFPAQGLPSPLIGMPNFDGGRQQIQRFDNQSDQNGRINQIGQRMIQEPRPIAEPKPMGTAYDAPESDKFATRIIMGETPKDKELAFKRQMGGVKNNLGYGDLAVKQRKQLLAEKVAEGKATDAEKHEMALDLIGARGDESMEQIGARNAGTMSQIGARGDIQKELANTRGNQALEQIGARVKGQKEVANLKPITASQQNVEQKNKARELAVTRPDLAQYLTIESNGNFTINPDTPLNELSMIQNVIYPKGQKDISLPSTKTSDSVTKPLSGKAAPAKPSAADLLKKYGG